jgi:predicted amidohydrolase
MMLKAGTVQFHHRANDKAYNMSVVERFAREAAARQVKLLAFPEMCLTGYWHVRNLARNQLEELAEPVPSGPSTQAVSELSARYEMAIGVGLIERAEDGRLFNTYVVCLPDGQVHRHRKLHAFESDDIASGDSYTVFDTPWGVKVGVLICWDNRTPARRPCSAPISSWRRIRPAAAIRAARRPWG